MAPWQCSYWDHQLASSHEAGRLQGCVILEALTSPDLSCPNLPACCGNGNGEPWGAKLPPVCFAGLCFHPGESMGWNPIDHNPIFSASQDTCRDCVQHWAGHTWPELVTVLGWCVPGSSGELLGSAPPSRGDTKHSGEKHTHLRLICFEQSCFGLPQVCQCSGTSLPCPGIAALLQLRHKQHHLNAEFRVCWAVCGDSSGLGGSSRLPRWCREAAPAVPCWGRLLLLLLNAQMVPITLMGSTGCLLWSLAVAPNYFQTSREPRLLKSTWWLRKVSVGRVVLCPSMSQPGAYGTEWWLGRDIRLGSCKSLLRDLWELGTDISWTVVAVSSPGMDITSLLWRLCARSCISMLFIIGWFTLEGTTGGHPGQPPHSSRAP